MMIREDYIINAPVKDAENYVRENGYKLYVVGEGNGLVTQPEDVSIKIVYVSVKDDRVSRVIRID